MKKVSLEQELKGNAYPVRGIVIVEAGRSEPDHLRTGTRSGK